MEDRRAYAFHSFMRAAILCGFSFYIVYLVKTGGMTHYLAPRLVPYVKASAIALFVLAVIQIYLALQPAAGNESDCGCEPGVRKSKLSHGAAYSLFLLPLLLGFLLPDRVTGSDIVQVKGIQLNTSNLQTQRNAGTRDDSPEKQQSSEEASRGEADTEEARLKEMFKGSRFTEDYAKLAMRLYQNKTILIGEKGFMERLTAVDLFAGNFAGKQMEISGFVYREDDMPKNQFVVARLTMQCCSADASPYGVIVEAPGADSYLKDTWVTVKGTIRKSVYEGKDVMKLEGAVIRKIKEPSSPYVYPYAGDFADLGK
ncbi:TIGR03943 family putative permease subunit [Paenibacillus chitinolyticus]|uniref:TIGR03943 family putative permease subunit n=1 Tax=Paenibacillus chitinolyticus TaxID=79263 RepID=UPI00366FFEB7